MTNQFFDNLVDLAKDDEVITHTVVGGTISEWGRTKINSHLNFSCGMPSLPDDWEWKPKVSDKEHKYGAGKFAKRVQRYYYQTCNTKIPAKNLEHIGQVAQDNLVLSNLYEFDFTEHIDWDDGDFDDEGSCFWGTNAGAKQMIQDNGLAIRFFAGKEGIGRAWIGSNGIDDSIVVFNGYGLETLEIAKILANWQGVEYKKIDLYNYGTTDGLLFINSSNYIVGPNEIIAKVKKVDLEWEGGHTMTCDGCGYSAHPDDCYHYQDNTYCESCFSDNFFWCEKCNETCAVEDRADIDGQWLCEFCAKKKGYIECEECETLTLEWFTGPNGDNYYCDDCFGACVSTCDRCDEVYYLTTNSHEHLCEDCDKHSAKCKHCNDWFVQNTDEVFCSDRCNAWEQIDQGQLVFPNWGKISLMPFPKYVIGRKES